MPNILHMIGESWRFAQKQHAVVQVGFWLIFLPTLASTQFFRWLELYYGAEDQQFSAEFITIGVLVNIGIALLTMWGVLSLLIIGKRFLQAKAGRNRTSFKSVRSESLPLIIPYILTSLIRLGVGLLWTLLLVVPGIIYFIRTTFFAIAMASEGVAYRPALYKSTTVVKGQTWQVLGSIMLTSFLLFIPTGGIQVIAMTMAEDGPWYILAAGDIVAIAASTVAVILSTFTLIQLYGYFKPSSYSN